jgi:hypothetical protein
LGEEKVVVAGLEGLVTVHEPALGASLEGFYKVFFL